MNISRRKFLGAGLLLATAPFVLKIHLLNYSSEDILENFIKQYESFVTLDNIENLQPSIDISAFKKDLELILVNNVEEDKWNLAVLEIIKKDYENGNIRVIDGWIISETEIKIELLKTQYV